MTRFSSAVQQRFRRFHLAVPFWALLFLFSVPASARAATPSGPIAAASPGQEAAVRGASGLPPVVPGPSALTDGPRIRVDTIQFEGNSAIDDASLAEVAAPFVGRFVSSEELHEMRRLLTQYYVDQGYISSGVVIPDQRVRDGNLRLRVIEGRLSGIKITGNQRLEAAYVADRLALAADGVLDIKRLREAVQLLHRDPLIHRLNAELVPGNQLGQSRLLARVEEADPFELSVAVNNYRPPSVGAYQLSLRGMHRNLSGRGDSLGIDYNLTETEQVDNYGARYSLPVSARETRLTLDYRHSNPTVLDAAFRDLDVVSLTERFAVGVSHPLLRSVDSSLTLGVRLERSQNRTFLLGRPYSFSLGPDDGRSTVTALRLSLDWLQRSLSEVVAARLSLNTGLDLFGATTHDDLPDGQFISLLAQVQWALRLGEGNRQLVLRASGQWASDHLLPLERFVVGGVNSVRGYRENRLVRDLGWVASAELRIPLREDAEGRPTLQFMPFVDVGQAWDRDGLFSSRETLLSVGAGLRWEPVERLHGVLYYGVPLRGTNDGGDDLQDRGIHFEIGYRVL